MRRLTRPAPERPTGRQGMGRVAREPRARKGRSETMTREKLTPGETYDMDALEHIGWTEGDGSGHEGYDAWSYFSGGRYIGPDEHGIEPLFDAD